VPLHNCCARGKDATPRSFVNFCENEDDAIRYYGPGMGHTANDLRIAIKETGSDIIVVGDSVSHQWYKTLFCYLGGFEIGESFSQKGLEADITESFLRSRPTWRTTQSMRFKLAEAFYIPMGKLKKGAMMKQTVQFMHVRSLDTDAVMDILDYYNDRYTKDFSRPKPIFVINLGLHYNLLSANPKKTSHGDSRVAKWSKSDLQEHMMELVTWCRTTNSKCILRETSPQHFDNKAGDGLYPGEAQANTCMSEAPASFKTLNQWRNDVMYEAIGKVVSKFGAREEDGGFLRVMPIFDKLAGLDANHHRTAKDMNEQLNVDYYKFDDCTHFTLEANIWEPWHISLTEVLEDIVDG